MEKVLAMQFLNSFDGKYFLEILVKPMQYGNRFMLNFIYNINKNDGSITTKDLYNKNKRVRKQYYSFDTITTLFLKIQEGKKYAQVVLTPCTISQIINTDQFPIMVTTIYKDKFNSCQKLSTNNQIFIWFLLFLEKNFQKKGFSLLNAA